MIATNQFDAIIQSIGLLKKIGKNLPFIVLAFAGINAILAIRDYSASQYPFAILNTIFATGGINFFIQLYKKSKIYNYNYHFKYT